MNAKWFGLAATLALGLGVGLTSFSLSYAAQDGETPLGAVMEKVQKQKTVITKGTRNKAMYAKSREDVETAAKEWVKLAKEAKPMNDVVKTSQGVDNAQAKWDEMMDFWEKESEKLVEIAGKADSEQKAAKDQLNTINKNCTACHQVFRIEEDDF